MKKGIIFDLDGTLWDSSKQVVPAWNIALSRHPELNKQITVEDMQGFMGKTIEKIAELMLPDVENEARLSVLKECCIAEVEYLSKHGATLYPDLEKTLTLLRKEYFLYIVSNCQDGYVQTFLDYHQLWDYFDDIEMSGRTGKCKGDNIKLIIERNELDKAVYVGDTSGDKEAAELAEIPFIHAEYGFGNLDNIEFAIHSIAELPDIVSDCIGITEY